VLFPTALFTLKIYYKKLRLLVLRRNDMKILKIILICLAGIVIAFGSFKISNNLIEKFNSRYIQENPVVTDKKQGNNEAAYSQDIDATISRSINGIKETTLPVKYEKNYIIYGGNLYVTLNNGKTWIQVPNDHYIGYAAVNDYLHNISESSMYLSESKIAIVYGGRGSENISIISSWDKGKSWSVGSISKTANHNLQKGYDMICIDFINDKEAYIAAISDEGTSEGKTYAFRSVNSGVTWDKVTTQEKLYNEIMKRFGIKESQ
jgi:hypothetical protein